MKKIAIPLLSLFLLLPSAILAQERRIITRSFDADILELRAKTNPVYDRNNQPAAMVTIFLSSVDSILIKGNILGDPIHTPGEWIIFMPEESEWIEVSADGCEPLHFDIPADKPLLSAYGYTLHLGTLLIDPPRTLIMPSFSYNKSHFSYGILLGYVKKNGGYIRVKTDFTFGLKPTLYCDGEGNVDGVKAWFSGESQQSRLAVMGGYLRKIIDPLFVYVGAGYGSRVLAWEMFVEDQKYEYARVTSNSYTGYEAELGLIFKQGIIAISAGVQTNQFKYFEANVGIGVMF